MKPTTLDLKELRLSAQESVIRSPLISMLSERYMLQLFITLSFRRSYRFNELVRLTDVNPHTVRQRVGTLVDAGLAVRHVVSELPPNVVVGLSKQGAALAQSLRPLLDHVLLTERGEHANGTEHAVIQLNGSNGKLKRPVLEA